MAILGLYIVKKMEFPWDLCLIFPSFENLNNLPVNQPILLYMSFICKGNHPESILPVGVSSPKPVLTSQGTTRYAENKI